MAPLLPDMELGALVSQLQMKLGMLTGFKGEGTSLRQQTARTMSCQETAPGGLADSTGKDLAALKRSVGGQ